VDKSQPTSEKQPARWRTRRFWLRLTLIVFLVAVTLPVALFVFANLACRLVAAGKMYRATEDIPRNDVAVVLGTSKLTKSGKPNLHFNTRIEAAVKLYQAGKVRHLLVSGDNRERHYNEPRAMRAALVEAGIPTNAITCDYAGLRTLDSVVRANSVFGLTNFTIVTEEFHCPRAIWIARRHGFDAVGFAAPDPESHRWTLRVKLRESFARVLCAFDLYILHTEPKHPGPPEPLILTASTP